MIKKQLLFLTLMLAMLALAACAPSPQSTPDKILAPAPTEIASETPIPQADGCPTETADLKLLMNAEDGYCLLYPAEYTALPPRFIVINPTNALGGDKIGDAYVDIIVEAAAGRAAAQVADGQIAEAGEGFNITRSDVMVDGKQAVVVDGLPGPDPGRKVFVVSGERLYTLSFLPWAPSNDPNQPTPLETLYTAVVTTFHFLPPTAIPSETPIVQANGCPAATADLKLMVNMEDGYCLLYPAEFTWDGGHMIVLNPYEGPGDIPGEVWMYVVVSDAGGKTAAQIVDAEITALGEGFNITHTELNVDGKQAILVDGMPAQDSTRMVYIVNKDRLYRFGFSPWFPKDGTTSLEKLYQTVVDSVHFLP